MKNKINIAELLIDCPKGMELDCTMFENVTFARVDMSKKQFPIEIVIRGKQSKYLTKEGCFHDTTLLPDAKCVIFPKGKTTWEGFVPPCKFKDGDVVVDNSGAIFLYKGIHTYYEEPYADFYCGLTSEFRSFIIKTGEAQRCGKISSIRLATEEEKEKLFQAIKDNGYKWNTETKTLEKFIEPKFKVGDKVQWKEDIREKRVIDNVLNNCYTVQGYGVILFTDQDKWELVFKHKFKVGDRIIHKESGIYCTIGEYIESFKGYNTNIGGLVVRYNDIDNWELYPLPNKFDITTFKPFEKVLMRSSNAREWTATLYSHYNNNKFYGGGMCCDQCIPYEHNEHLRGTTNDCDKFYKTWK